MKKFTTYLFIIILFTANLLASDLYLYNYQKTEYPTLELNLAAFDSDYRDLDFVLADLKLSINQQDVIIDSSLQVNAISQEKSNLIVTFEISNAINDEDFEAYKQIIDEYSASKSQFSKISFVLLMDKPFVLNNNPDQAKLQIDELSKLTFHKKANLNNFLSSTLYSEITEKSQLPNAFILITKSQIKIDKNLFVQKMVENTTNFVHIRLGESNYPLYDAINSVHPHHTLDANILELDKVIQTSVHLVTSGKFYRIFAHSKLNYGSNSVQITLNNQSNILYLNISENQLPKLFVNNPTLFLGIGDSGKVLRQSINLSSNLPLFISDISFSNPAFSAPSFKANTKVTPEQPYSLKLEYLAINDSFDSSNCTIKTNAGDMLQLFLYSGKFPSKTSEISIVSPLENDEYLTDDNLAIVWKSTHPVNVFQVDFKLTGQLEWTKVTSSANSNYLSFRVPNIPDTLAEIRISQIDSNSISEKVMQLIGHKDKITQIAFNSNDSLIATASEDGKILLWNAKTGENISTLFQSQSKIISTIAWTKDSKYLAFSASDTTIKIWDIDKGILYKDRYTSDNINKIYFSADNNYLIAQLFNNTVEVFSYPELIKENTITFVDDIQDFQINPSYPYFFVATSKSKFYIYDFENKTYLNDYPVQDFNIISASFSPNGNNLALSGSDNKIRIYDIKTAVNVLNIFDINSPIRKVFWLKNKIYIASTQDKYIKLWSPTDGSLEHIYDQHNSEVYQIQGSNNGKRVASVDQDNIIHLWNLDDLPFSRPALLSSISNPFRIIERKIEMKDYLLPNSQVGDTLSYYLSDICTNKTQREISIDTLIISSDFKDYWVDERLKDISLQNSKSISATINLVPKKAEAYNFQVTAKSDNKTYYSNLHLMTQAQSLDPKRTIIDFGELNIGNSIDTLIFVMQNISQQPIIIDSFQIINNSEFTMISPSMPYSIKETGGTLVPNLRFSPEQIGFTSGIVRFYPQKFLPFDIYLYGIGLAPKLEQASEIEDAIILCEDQKIIEIPIINSGNALLEIQSIEIISQRPTDFVIIKDLQHFIKPNQIDTLIIDWLPKSFADESVTIRITTNLQEDGITSNEIIFKVKKDIIGLLPAENPVYYFPNNDNDAQQKSIQIYQNGNLSSQISLNNQLKYFRVDSIQIIDIGYFLNISFVGGYGYDKYIDTLIISDDCGKITNLELIANINKAGAIISVQDTLDFGQILCEKSKTIDLLIQNTGTAELQISNIALQTPNPHIEFSPLQLSIMPNSYSYIQVKYNSTEIANNLQNTILLYSNAENATNGISEIIMIGTEEEINYTFSVDTIYFGELSLTKSDTAYVQFSNIGTIPISNYFKVYTENFQLSYTEQANILPNQKQNIAIYFDASIQNETIIDSLVFQDECKNTKKVILIGSKSTDKQILTISLPYPNPTSSDATVQIQSNIKYEMNYQLTDYLGRLIDKSHTNEVMNADFNLEIDLANYSTGIYLLKLNINNTPYYLKIIKI